MTAVVGRRAALEAVRSGRARELLVVESSRDTEGMRELLEAAAGAGIPLRRVPVEDVEDLAGGERHQGVAARVELPAALTEADLTSREWPPSALVVALDGVTDPRNVGAIARTAEASGASALVVRRRRGAGATPAAVRASAGALLHLAVAEVANVHRALGRLKAQGFWVVGLEADAPRAVWESEPPAGRLAMVLGSEGTGLSRLMRQGCDELLAIPLRGRVRSLNVSVAAGIALFSYAVAGRARTGM